MGSGGQTNESLSVSSGVVETTKTEAPLFSITYTDIGGANIHGDVRSANFFSQYISTFWKSHNHPSSFDEMNSCPLWLDHSDECSDLLAFLSIFQDNQRRTLLLSSLEKHELSGD